MEFRCHLSHILFPYMPGTDKTVSVFVHLFVCQPHSLNYNIGSVSPLMVKFLLTILSPMLTYRH